MLVIMTFALSTGCKQKEVVLDRYTISVDLDGTTYHYTSKYVIQESFSLEHRNVFGTHYIKISASNKNLGPFNTFNLEFLTKYYDGEGWRHWIAGKQYCAAEGDLEYKIEIGDRRYNITDWRIMIIPHQDDNYLATISFELDIECPEKSEKHFIRNGIVDINYANIGRKVEELDRVLEEGWSF